MPEQMTQKTYLTHYTPFTHNIEQTDLYFRLDPSATIVESKIRFVPNAPGVTTLRLDGEGLKLITAKIDGCVVEPEIDERGLTVSVPDAAFTWEAVVEINPSANTALEGLYMSKGMYCTQCEAEGFRRITYYPDRPDVMAPFRVSIAGNEPVMLSNGNPVARRDGEAMWHDPWPKPAYLFALAAGELRATKDKFTTASGREVELAVWVRPGDENRTEFALESLKKSMIWDEQVYGREYDLDVFNIVAVDDFNMGAMENKGLNIFNSKYVLADPETATDRDYELIEAIVAHEYFHNWTGNRITCRDWFQLCLKEGLTVYRDQQFTSDLRSASVKRIEDVDMLRRRQFREDSGPLAHPVRPEEYTEINNFYTATVYEKGAELIGMLRLIIGEAAWKAGCELYFERHDGDAATIEDWLACFAETSGKGLQQFQLWYSQAGTPLVEVATEFDGETVQLNLKQTVPDTAGQTDKLPMVIPFSFGLLSESGSELLATKTVILDQSEATWRFPLSERPIVSALRGFSAPVRLRFAQPLAERLVLMAHDTDPFARREAARAVAMEQLLGRIAENRATDPDYLEAIGALLFDDKADPAFRALAVALPSEEELAATLFEAGVTPDPDQIHIARKAIMAEIAAHHQSALEHMVERGRVHGAYSPDADQAGRRSLWRAALGLLAQVDEGHSALLAFNTAQNMTERLAALSLLISLGKAEAPLAQMEEAWSGDPGAMDKWFMLQINSAPAESAVDVTARLLKHPLFSRTTPNRVRSVLGALPLNQAGFHRADGAGYRLLGDELAKLDDINPQTAARLSTAFETWKRFDTQRQTQLKQVMQSLHAKDGLSRDLGEMLSRMLG